ncbi:MAG: AAA family ATPase [Phycisphaeraceae bacterium]|nr:AAA family ATPase [Phycisphaeraceae bacterium]
MFRWRARWAWISIARPDGQRWAIAERDGAGEVIGTAYRLPDGRKDFATGGRRGLILPWPLHAYAGATADRPVYVCEGASDAASLLGLGLDAVGVPMAGHGGDLLGALLAGRHAVVIADADDAGRTGAARLAGALIGRCASVRTIEAPEGAKDCREAVIAGANRSAFETLAARAAPLRAQPASLAGGAIVVRLADVTPEPVSWLWPGRIALGKVTLIAGDPGLGKSFLTLDMAARISSGAGWPDGGERPAPGGVVLLSAEDSIADTIRPRLDAAGADPARIIALESIRSLGENGRVCARSFDLSRDLPALDAAVESVGDCRLVVIDPVTAYLGGVDSHKNAEIRGLLAPLGELAMRHRVAVVAVTHLNKAGGGPAIYRAMGSLAFAAAARAAWAVSKDRADPMRRLLLPIKNNLAPDAGGLAYRIDGAGPAVAWEAGTVHVSADEALARDGMWRRALNATMRRLAARLSGRRPQVGPGRSDRIESGGLQ